MNGSFGSIMGRKVIVDDNLTEIEYGYCEKNMERKTFILAVETMGSIKDN